MISLPVSIFGLCFYGLLGAAWVKGYDAVKQHAPDYFPQFYLVMAVIRVVFVLTAIGVYLLVLSQSHEESVAFVVMMMGMYAVMMTVTLILKH
jgi:uncharacterized Tic20 family protein